MQNVKLIMIYHTYAFNCFFAKPGFIIIFKI